LIPDAHAHRLSSFTAGTRGVSVHTGLPHGGAAAATESTAGPGPLQRAASTSALPPTAPRAITSTASISLPPASGSYSSVSSSEVTGSGVVSSTGPRLSPGLQTAAHLPVSVPRVLSPNSSAAMRRVPAPLQTGAAKSVLADSTKRNGTQM